MEGCTTPKDLGGRNNTLAGTKEIGEDGVIEDFGNTSASRKRNQTCDHLVEGHEEGGADHGIPIVFQRDKNKMRVLSPRMHRKATEIRHGETEENEDKEQSEEENQNRDIGLQTAQLDFEVFNLNA